MLANRLLLFCLLVAGARIAVASSAELYNDTDEFIESLVNVAIEEEPEEKKYELKEKEKEKKKDGQGTCKVDPTKPPTDMMDKIKQKIEDGSFFDGEEVDGMFVNAGDMTFTSKGMVDRTKPMPEGVPPDFPLIRRGMNAFASSKDVEAKEKKYIKLFDSLVANEKEWLQFLDHPYHFEHVYESIKVLHALAHDIHYERGHWNKAREVIGMEEKLFIILERLHSDDEQSQVFDHVQYEMHEMLFALYFRPGGVIESKTAQILKNLIAYEKVYQPPKQYNGYAARWANFYLSHVKMLGEKRGITVNRNTRDVPDELIVEYLTFVKNHMEAAGRFDDPIVGIASDPRRPNRQ